jgi:hypothetical protein
MFRQVVVIGVATMAAPVVQANAQQPVQDRRPQEVLAQLAGTWTFQMYVPGRAYPWAKGRREISLMADSLKLSWTDTYEGTPATGAGFLGYDERAQAYYLMGVRSGVSTPMFLLGAATADRIRFDPNRTAGSYGNAPGAYQLSELQMVDRTRFVWMMNENGWWADFTRVGGP